MVPNDMCSVIDEDDNDDLQLEADAAAPLLHLKARKLTILKQVTL